MHLIWCHQTILDKIFECLECRRPLDDNKSLINLLFDMLYLFSEQGKILQPLRKTARFPQFQHLLEAYLLSPAFRFRTLVEPILEFMVECKVYMQKLRYAD